MGTAARTTPRSAAIPGVRTLGAAGGRFISRGRLLLRALYWLGWLIFSRREVVSSSVERELDAIGLGALRLVTSASLLLGLIATFQIAYQLAPYGAESLSARAIGWFTARELGPLSVALLVVARSASAIAGELGSMSADGEIDALRAMGLDPVKYLVAPKLAALLVALPVLTILADGLIVVGGWIGSTIFLGFNSRFFLEQFRSGFEVRDLLVGLAKAFLFTFIVAVIPADEGLSVQRRVAAIGEATTRAVVFSLIVVLAADTIVNAVFYFIPGLVY